MSGCCTPKIFRVQTTGSSGGPYTVDCEASSWVVTDTSSGSSFEIPFSCIPFDEASLTATQVSDLCATILNNCPVCCPEIVATPVVTPAATGNTTNLSSFVTDTNGDCYYIDASGNAKLIQSGDDCCPVIVAAPVATPAATGNTTNLSSFVTDSLGDIYYIDYLGNAILIEDIDRCCADIVTTPLAATPAATGNTINLNSFVIGPTGACYFIDHTGASKLIGCCPSVNATPVAFTPAAAGNTTNFNEFVTDPNGDVYYIDNDGNAVLVETEGAPTVNLVPVTFTPSAAGNTQNLNEFVTDPDGNCWFIDVDGDAKLLEIADTGSPLINTTPVATTPAATGNTTNLNQFVIDPNGNCYFVDVEGNAKLLQQAIEGPNVNLVPVTFTPASTGNTTNLNEFVIDPNGDVYFIDFEGEATPIETNVVGAPVINTTVLAATPAASGNTTNLNELVTDPNGDCYFIDVNGVAKLIEEAGGDPLINPVPVGSTPLATGNTSNLNEFVTDPNGDCYFIDSDGNSKLIATDDTLTSLAFANVNGSCTLTYTDENGTPNQISLDSCFTQAGGETLTSLAFANVNGSCTITYTDENGTPNQISLDSCFTQAGGETLTTVVENGDGTVTYTDENGDPTTFDACCPDIVTAPLAADPAATGNLTNLSSFVTGPTGKCFYIDAGGDAKELGSSTTINNTTTVTTPTPTGNTTNLGEFVTDTNGDCYYIDTDGNAKLIETAETVTTIVDNGSSFTYTNEAGAQVIVDYSETLTSLAFANVNGSCTITYTDENGTPNQISLDGCFAQAGGETVTTIVDNGDGTVTYTDENGDPTTFDACCPDIVTTPVAADPAATGNLTNLSSFVTGPTGKCFYIDAEGDAKELGSSAVINTTPIAATPAATGNTTNLNEFITDPNGDCYFIDAEGNSKLIQSQFEGPSINPTPVTTTPGATGNTTNLGEFVLDQNGDCYYIDPQGNAKLIETNVIGGPVINPVAVAATPAAAGNVANLNEFVTDPNGDCWFIDQDGRGKLIEAADNGPVINTTPLAATPAATGNTTNLNEFVTDPNGDCYFIDDNGVSKQITDSETLTSLAFANVNGSCTITYTDENGTPNQISLDSCFTQAGGETLTTIVDNGDGTVTYTDENGDPTVFDACCPDIVATPLAADPAATGNATNLSSFVTGPTGKCFYIDAGGDAKELGSSTSINTTPVTTPAATGNTTNLGEFVTDTNGDCYFIDNDGNSKLIQSACEGPSVNATPVAATPAATGNTTNLNEFVTDPDGNCWFIDCDGNAKQISSTAAGIAITDNMDGSYTISNGTDSITIDICADIAQYCDVSGGGPVINPTPVTTPAATGNTENLGEFVVDGNGDCYFIDEAGSSKLIQSACEGPSVNATPVAAAPAATGNTTNLNEFVTDPDGNCWFVDCDGNAKQIAASSSFTVTDNGDGSYTIDDGTNQVVIDICADVNQFCDLGSTTEETACEPAGTPDSWQWTEWREAGFSGPYNEGAGDAGVSLAVAGWTYDPNTDPCTVPTRSDAEFASGIVANGGDIPDGATAINQTVLQSFRCTTYIFGDAGTTYNAQFINNDFYTTGTGRFERSVYQISSDKNTPGSDLGCSGPSADDHNTTLSFVMPADGVVRVDWYFTDASLRFDSPNVVVPGATLSSDFALVASTGFSLEGAFADDADAAANGVSAGQYYQTDGTAASPLNVAGILMVKQ